MKIFVLVMVILIAVSLLAGCGSSPATTTNQTTTSAATSATSTTQAIVPTQPMASTQPSTPKVKTGGVLRITLMGEGTESIGYPPKMVKTFSYYDASPAIETLFRFDKQGKLVPWLATGMKSDSATNSITITIRKGVKFHDGTDFNSDAVKWNLDEQKIAKGAGSEKIASVDVIDDSNVKVNLTGWDSSFESNLGLVLGMMISPTAAKANGADWCIKNPVGTGPFQFVSWQQTVKITYKKFGNYWQSGKPYLDGVEIIPMADSTTQIMSLRGEEVDVVPTLAAKDVAQLEKDGYLITRSKVGAGALGLVPDSAHSQSPFSNIKVRQAVQYAIDSNSLVKSVLFGEAEAANQWAYTGHWSYNTSVVGYPYNPEKAKQLLAEAGYSNGFTTKLNYLNSNIYNQYALPLQGFLKAVNISAELVSMPNAAFTQAAMSSAGWEGLLVNFISPNPDSVIYLNTRYSGGDKFASMMLPDDYLAAIRAAVAAPDFTTKQKLVQDVQKLIVDKYCLQNFVYASIQGVATQPYVRDSGFLTSAQTTQWTPEDAWINK